MGINDIDKLQEISIKTFSETFLLDNTDEDMNKYLKESFSKDKLRLELK